MTDTTKAANRLAALQAQFSPTSNPEMVKPIVGEAGQIVQGLIEQTLDGPVKNGLENLLGALISVHQGQDPDATNLDQYWQRAILLIKASQGPVDPRG